MDRLFKYTNRGSNGSRSAPTSPVPKQRFPFKRAFSAERLEKGDSNAPGLAASAISQAFTEPAALSAVARQILTQMSREPLFVGPNVPNVNDFSIFQRVRSQDSDELVKLTSKSLRGKRAMGAMVGMAVADSVGHMFEFLPIDQKGARFNPKTLKVVGAYNKFSLKPGQWTDDTSMGLCLADSLLAQGKYDGSDIRVRFWNWWYRGYNNAFRNESSRSKSVGLGGNISASLSDIRDSKPPPRFEADNEDAGNGSLMRLAPVPIMFHKDPELAIRMSSESSYTTHPGCIAANGCAFLGFLITRAITRDANNKQTFAQFLDKCVADYIEVPEVGSQADMLRLLRSAEPVGSTERCWNWRDSAGPYLMETVSARGDDYNGYPVNKGYVGSYSMDGLAIALHSVYHTNSFMAALARCVNLLGDADSTGAITGQLAGSFYGIDGIDKRLITRLRQWDNGEIALRGALLYARGIMLSGEARRKAREEVGLCKSKEEMGLGGTDETTLSFKDILMSFSAQNLKDSQNGDIKKDKVATGDIASAAAAHLLMVQREIKGELELELTSHVNTSRRSHPHTQYFHAFSSGDDHHPNAYESVGSFSSDLDLAFDSPAEELPPAKFCSGGLIPEDEAPHLPSSAFELNLPEPPPRSICPSLLTSPVISP